MALMTEGFYAMVARRLSAIPYLIGWEKREPRPGALVTHLKAKIPAFRLGFCASGWA